MTDQKPFAPKDAETIKAETLERFSVEYEDNEDFVDKIIEDRLKDEEMKASLHEQKKNVQEKLRVAEEDKVDKKEKGAKAPEPKGVSEKYTLKDIRALNDVPDDDVDEVTDYAKFKGISIAEAKENPVIQTLLKQKAEERASAEATTTGTKRKGSGQSENDKLLDNLSQGIKPDTEEDNARLAEAQFNQLLKKK